MPETTYRIWMDKRWVEFPSSALTTNETTTQRWTTVLHAEAVLHPKSKPRPQGANYMTAEHLGDPYTGDLVRWVLTRIRTHIRTWRRQHLSYAVLEEAPASTVEDSVRTWDTLLGATRSAVALEAMYGSEMRKVIVIADLHGHPHPSLLPAIIEEAGRDPDMDVSLLVVGDIYNVFATVPARQVLRDPARGAEVMKTEVAGVEGFFRALTANLPHIQITLLPGNHDELHKLFTCENPYAVIRVLRAYLDDEIDPIKRLVNKFPHIELGGRNLSYIEPNGSVHSNFNFNRFVHLFGKDLLVSHTNEIGKDAHRSLWRWVQDHGRVTGLTTVRVCLQAHVHRATLESVEGGHVHLGLIGFGGEVHTQTYKFNYKLWPSDVVPAFQVLHQEDKGFEDWRTVTQGVYGPRTIFI